MYYKLDKIKVENISRNPERFNILSEIVDSGISFSSPVVVDSVRELELWFGKSFEEHDYFCGLLEAGVSLYLYKPVLPPKDSFISGFTEVREFKVSFPLMALPERGESGIIYSIGFERKKKYLWTGIRWMEIKDNPGEKDWVLVSEEPLKYKRTLSKTRTEEVEITKIIDSTETTERLVTLSQAESTKVEDRIGKVYVLSDGTRYIWYEWIRLEDLKLLPDFNESDYNKKAIDVETLPEITDKNRGELGKNIYRLPEIGEVILYGDSTWMDADYFPQTIENTSESLNNRDTLLITSSEFKGFPYTYPKYNKEIGRLEHMSLGVDVNFPYSIENILDGTESYVFRVEFPEEIDEGFIVIPDKNDKLTVLCCGEVNRNIVPTSYAPEEKPFRTKKAFLKILEELGYIKLEEDVYASPNPLRVIDFSTIPGLRVIPDKETSLQLINSKIEDSTDNIEVWSRCIGKDSDPYDDTQYISLTIEEGTLPGYYRVVIEKYGYSEVFEAPIFANPGEDCLEYKINNKSDLIQCRLKSKNIRTGTYILRGGTDESKEYAPEMYRASLTELFDSRGAQLYTDYLLIPDVSKYGLEIGEDLTYSIYHDFLNLSKENRLQVLIQNELQETYIKEVEKLPEIFESDVVYKFENKYYRVGKEIIEPKELLPMLNGGNFVFNLLDNENRLIYFLSPIQTPSGKEFPGYSLFLNDFLSGVFNDFVSEDIIYPRVAIDPYSTESFEKILTKYKSNYLTINNHKYYYKKYLSGDKCKFTILRQFILGKIYRELMKLSRTLLAKRKKSEIENLVNKTLETLVAAFPSVISVLKVAECDLNLQQNKLTLKIESSLKELVEEDILLDITINYNENGNSIAIS